MTLPFVLALLACESANDFVAARPDITVADPAKPTLAKPLSMPEPTMPAASTSLAATQAIEPSNALPDAVEPRPIGMPKETIDLPDPALDGPNDLETTDIPADPSADIQIRPGWQASTFPAQAAALPNSPAAKPATAGEWADSATRASRATYASTDDTPSVRAASFDRPTPKPSPGAGSVAQRVAPSTITPPAKSAARSPAQPGKQAMPAPVRVHTLRWGETLTQIASENHLPLGGLHLANDYCLSDKPRAEDPIALTTDSDGLWRVRRGQTASCIAEMAGTSSAAIAAANNLADKDTIFAGQVLHLPTSR